eukprot:TRINITY_DN19853_c0_g1_i8.p2 TRINITY_DN19853_c0_g1~~TRINITY_DN19853_c0_g1_i8.p2  ORF type:complete len:163 (-),score=11.93 TRINITY_DN19853_c0_g1_i8:134-622(-)
MQNNFHQKNSFNQRIVIVKRRASVQVKSGTLTLTDYHQKMDSHIQLGDKVVYIMRHGTTHMNEWLHENQYNSCFDPMMYDTRLSERGVLGAKRMAATTAHLNPKPEVIIASPLTRALQTVEFAFADVDCPRIAEPLGREKIFHASDIGRSPYELQQEFPKQF